MSVHRRQFLRSLGIGTLGLTFPEILFPVSRNSERPNILFIMTDDHAERAISSYGSNLLETPGIDRIAREGVRFENSFVTNSICAPSRAVMLTGKYSHVNGLRDNRDKFDGSQMTFPKLLREAGYFTGVVGKWHLKTEPTGFDLWKILKGQGNYYSPEFSEQGTMRKYSGYTTDLITDKAIEVLRGRPKEKPFCMLVHHKAPHRNFMPNVTHLEEFADTDFPLPPTFHDDYEGRPAAEHADMRIEDMFLSFDLKLKPWAYEQETGTGGNAEFAEQAPEMLAQACDRMTKEQKEVWDSHYDQVSREFRESDLTGRALSEWKYQRYIRDYFRCVRSVDENVERLLDYLDQEGLAQNTLVIYTSDQGFYLGEHGWYDKRFMYEESLRTPLVMRFPQEVPGGLVKDDMVLNLDLAPTILDFAGISPPDGMQGRSLRTVAGEKPAENWRDSVYYHYYEYPHGWHDVYKHYGVRTDRYKLIHFYDEIDHWELYDLKEDPGEMTNRYADPAYQQTVKRLKGELERLRRKFGDTTP